MRLAALAAIASFAACDRTVPVTSCDDNLAGVWQTDAGPWMLLDHGTGLEGYPLFADAPAASTPTIVTAPRSLALTRDPRGLAGAITRRFMQGATACNARAAVRVTRCANDTLELVLADPAEPAFTPEGCKATRPPSSRIDRWRR
ncbi:MAG: hypothetical protein H0T79_06585 [Deltaproteobacteria bacterium]|nr:hypothetical protein [Deltaproteobacteria bacterium]